MSTLRSSLIHLASKHPKFRKELLPLIRTASKEEYDPAGEMNYARMSVLSEIEKRLRVAFAKQSTSIDVNYLRGVLVLNMRMTLNGGAGSRQDYTDVFYDLNPLTDPQRLRVDAHGQILAEWDLE